MYIYIHKKNRGLQNLGTRGPTLLLQGSAPQNGFWEIKIWIRGVQSEGFYSPEVIFDIETGPT